MINPRSIIISSIIISLLLAVFLYNLTASAFSNPPTSEILLSTNTDKLKVEMKLINSSKDVSNPVQFDANHPEINSCAISERFPPSVLQWCELITRHGIEQQIDPDLLAALILQESAGDPLAYSRSGAVGLMQVMPRDGLAENFMCKNGPCFSNRPTIEELQQPEFNVAYGSQLLAGLISHYGNVRDALKAYGPKDVGYSYSDIVIGLYNRYKS